MSISNKDLDYIKGRYQKRILEHGVGFASMNSGTEEKQKIRHSVHASCIPESARVLDVGCGIGQFYQHLKGAGFRGHYVGMDIVPEYVEHCKNLYPDATFLQKNIFEAGLDEQYDVIVASQVFNARYSDADNELVLKDFLGIAFRHSRQAVSVDMLTSYADFNVKELFYYTPESVFAHAKSLSRLVSLRHDYLPFEFALQVFHSKAS